MQWTLFTHDAATYTVYTDGALGQADRRFV